MLLADNGCWAYMALLFWAQELWQLQTGATNQKVLLVMSWQQLGQTAVLTQRGCCLRAYDIPNIPRLGAPHDHFANAHEQAAAIFMQKVLITQGGVPCYDKTLAGQNFS